SADAGRPHGRTVPHPPARAAPAASSCRSARPPTTGTRPVTAPARPRRPVPTSGTGRTRSRVRSLRPAPLEDLLDAHTECVGDAETQFQRRRVAPRLQRDDGLPGDAAG